MSVCLSGCRFVCLFVCAILDNPLTEVVETFGQIAFLILVWDEENEKNFFYNFPPKIVKIIGFEHPPATKK